MGLDDQLVRDAGSTLQTVDVLGEQLVQQALLGQEADEDVRDGRVKVARVEVLGENIKRLRIAPKEIELEDSLGPGQVKLS